MSTSMQDLILQQEADFVTNNAFFFLSESEIYPNYKVSLDGGQTFIPGAPEGQVFERVEEINGIWYDKVPVNPNQFYPAGSIQVLQIIPQSNQTNLIIFEENRSIFVDTITPDTPENIVVDNVRNDSDELVTQVSGQAEPFSNVSVFDADNNLLGSVKTDDEGNFSLTADQLLAVGTQYTVTSTDRATNTSTPASITGVTVDEADDDLVASTRMAGEEGEDDSNLDPTFITIDEEGDNLVVSTKMAGEEGEDDSNFDLTIIPIDEEGDDLVVSTKMAGEEGDDDSNFDLTIIPIDEEGENLVVSTKMAGEEGEDDSSLDPTIIPIDQEGDDLLASTMMVGEEGEDDSNLDLTITTLALGEEGDDLLASTMMVGEEGDWWDENGIGQLDTDTDTDTNTDTDTDVNSIQLAVDLLKDMATGDEKYEIESDTTNANIVTEDASGDRELSPALNFAENSEDSIGDSIALLSLDDNDESIDLFLDVLSDTTLTAENVTDSMDANILIQEYMDQPEQQVFDSNESLEPENSRIILSDAKDEFQLLLEYTVVDQ